MSATGNAPAPAPAPASDLAQRLDAITAAVEKLADSPERKSMPVPSVRKGEDPLTSRGYSFLKLFQTMNKTIDPSHAKVEIEMHNLLQKHWFEENGATRAEANTVLAPIGAGLLPQNSDSQIKFAKQVRDVVKAGMSGYDPDEYRRFQKSLSWQVDSDLGALVAPPQFGELIDVLRNNEVLSKAGASTIGLPPNGRIVFPRQTGASSAYYIGESIQLTESQPTTGDLILQAKKLSCLVKIPNELFRYASVSVEAFIRNDMAKVLALKMDKELLEGVGSAYSPKGLINYNILTHTSAGSPADGNSGYPLQPEDLAVMIAKVEDVNAVFKSWIMRPLLWSYLVNKRADAVSAGDSKGLFLFNTFRGRSDAMDLARDEGATLEGYPVYKSTQLSKTRTRGTGATNNTYLLGGDFADYVIAMSPTVEFALSQQGDSPFTYDQTWIRAILVHDGGPRHEASFILCDQLLQGS